VVLRREVNGVFVGKPHFSQHDFYGSHHKCIHYQKDVLFLLERTKKRDEKTWWAVIFSAQHNVGYPLKKPMGEKHCVGTVQSIILWQDKYIFYKGG